MNEIKEILGTLFPIAVKIGQFLGMKISEAIDVIFPPDGNNENSTNHQTIKNNE